MKKLILGLCLLLALVSCNATIENDNNIVDNTTTKEEDNTSKNNDNYLLETYYNVYYDFNYDNAHLIVQYITYTYENDELVYNVEKEWDIKPNNFTIIYQFVYRVEYNNIFYVYKDFYIVRNFIKYDY